ncbi:MAG: hypothetical protein ACRCTW_07515 [Lactococcus garvieae]
MSDNRISLDILYQSIGYLEDILIDNLKRLSYISECVGFSNENYLAIEKIKGLNEVLIDELSRNHVLPVNIRSVLIDKSIEIRVISSKIQEQITSGQCGA